MEKLKYFSILKYDLQVYLDFRHKHSNSEMIILPKAFFFLSRIYPSSITNKYYKKTNLLLLRK